MVNPVVCLGSAEFEPATLLDWNVVAVVGIAVVLGIVGGSAGRVRLAKNERPAVGGSLFVAAIAAIAAFYVLEPTTPLKFIAACIIAGYTGPAVLDALEARFKLEVAQQKAARATQVGQQAVAVAEQALKTNEPQEEGLDTRAASVDALRAHVQKLKQEMAVIASWPSGDAR